MLFGTVPNFTVEFPILSNFRFWSILYIMVTTYMKWVNELSIKYSKYKNLKLLIKIKIKFILQQRRVNLHHYFPPPKSKFLNYPVIYFLHILKVKLTWSHFHIELIQLYEWFNQISLFLNLTCIQAYISSQDNTTQTFMEEMGEKLVIFNHFYHFTALNPQIVLEVLNT